MPYSHPAIAVWNALVRFGFFLTTALLLDRLHTSLRAEQRLARTDALTALYSRRAFEDRLAHDLSLARRHGSPLTLVYVDVDDFKRVNDLHGHAAGDGVLKEIGRLLKESTRAADTAARLGGDEFALILPDTDAHGARQVIAKLARELREALGTWGVNCSIGVVTFLGVAIEPERAVAVADKLMYQVKSGGKGRAEFSVFGESVVQPHDSPDR